MVRVQVKVAGRGARLILDAPAELSLLDLLKSVSLLTAISVENLKLVRHGSTITSNDENVEKMISLSDNESIIAMVSVVPQISKPQPCAVLDEEEDDENDLKFEIPENASKLQKSIGIYLRKLKTPGQQLYIESWGLVVLWFIMAPVLQMWELGPIYIILTCFALIFWNLGTRKRGEWSAYSIFNEGFRELPGTLNAERIDRDIRAGNY